MPTDVLILITAEAQHKEGGAVRVFFSLPVLIQRPVDDRLVNQTLADLQGKSFVLETFKVLLAHTPPQSMIHINMNRHVA